MKKVFLLLVLVNVGYSMFSQELWNGTRYRMSLDDVKKLHPSSSAPTNPATLYWGGIELLRLNDIEIDDDKFHASFFFQDDGLVQVTLTPDADTRNTRIGENLFIVLKRLLMAKYGKEIIFEEDEFGGIIRKIMIWMSRDTNITLVYTVYPRSFTDLYSLNVQYQTRIAEEMKKL
jgi:hypothetical protein